MQMDWISLLKAQQTDFLQRVKKPKTIDLSLLEGQVKGCHGETMVFWGDTLEKILESSHQQAEILAKNPPPIPPEYPQPPDWTIPFPKFFQSQATDYLVREKIVDIIITERLGKLVKKVPQDTLENMLFDDEGNLRSTSKFAYCLTNQPTVNIQVHVADSESFTSIKKDKISWTVTQEDVKNYQVFIFLCLFFPSSTQLGYQKQTIIAGFLPTNQLQFSEPKLSLHPSSLLYAGGLNWYLQSLSGKKYDPAKIDIQSVAEVIQTLPSEHPQKHIIGDWECWQTLTGHTKGINCLAYSIKALSVTDLHGHNVKTVPILASGSHGETKLWDLSKGELIETLLEYPWSTSGLVDHVNSLAFSTDSQILVSVGADSTIKIWHTGALDLIDILHKHQGNVRCIAFTPDGQTLLTGGDDRKILFWNLRDRHVEHTLSLDDTAAHSMVLSEDGRILVTGSYRKIKIWHLSSLRGRKKIHEVQPIYTLKAHSHIVNSLVMTANSKYLISGSQDKNIKVWKLATGELIHTLKSHQSGVYTLALSPNEQIIASGSADKTIKLWHLETGELLATFSGHANTVTSLVFTASGEMLVSGSLDKTIKIWQRSEN
ncbi:MAG: WD40 repeat domain-containing protein [Nostocales cyanobacterium]|nr:MAG: WD40 repeat domain-containing protein [Nostocales cyanobacterium]TAF18410.1 MAG: WD40 repeat domain-containing protein [Nostocales cyanobacterium]